MPTTLLIVYHSRTGGTEQMALAARRGAQRADDLQVRLLHACDAGPDDLLAAQAYLFATPENLAAIAGQMKEFFDGSDGSNAVRQVERIATGWRLRKIAESLIICTHAQTPEAILAGKTIPRHDLQRCEDFGETLGQGLVMGLF